MMLGARNGAWAKSGGGVPTASDYVQDGLIAMWDGIENAGLGVHDPSATIWKDLVGGYDVSNSYSNMTWTDNGYSFGNIVDNFFYRSSATEILDTVKSKLFTMEVVRSSYSPITNAGFISLGGNSRRNIMIFDGKSNTIIDISCIFLGANTGSAGITGSNLSFVRTFVGDGSSILIYTNSTGGISGQFGKISNNDSQLYIGRISYTVGNTVCNGIVNSIRFYSRALTAAEIAHNYEIDKARFNLP